jgi:prepilin-type N-terminal cleavage/methylation domain-containing protein
MGVDYDDLDRSDQEFKSLNETCVGGHTVEWRKSMRIRSILNKNGVTLIELLVVMVIAAITMAGIYRVFIGQTKTYAIQDQVMEVQQSVRGAMEIMLRDLRMTGFDDDNQNSDVTIANPLLTPVQTSDITITYEYYDRNLVGTEAQKYQTHLVRYWRDGGTSRLMRQLTVDAVARPAEIILENVNALTLTYGVDVNLDGIMDDQNGNGQIDTNDWRTAAQVVALGNPRVVAINVSLTGRPDQTNVDVSKVVSPRTLVSAVTLRNLSLR